MRFTRTPEIAPPVGLRTVPDRERPSALATSPTARKDMSAKRRADRFTVSSRDGDTPWTVASPDSRDRSPCGNINDRDIAGRTVGGEERPSVGREGHAPRPATDKNRLEHGVGFGIDD